MFIRRSLQVGRNCTTGIALMLTFASTGMGQTAPDPESEPESSDTPEEIVVYGKKSIVQLRREWYVAEESFFSVFNSLNTNKDFEVTCEYVVYLGDRRRHHVCMPRFATRFEAQRSSSIILGKGGFSDGVGSTNWVRMKQKNELLWQKMAELMLDHPELREAVGDLQRVKAAHDFEVEKRKAD